MSYTETMTQKLSVCDVINSQNVNNTSVNSLGVNIANFKRLMYVVQLGQLASTQALDGRLQSCSLANFASNVHNITNTNLTQINNTTTPNTGISTIEVESDMVVQQNQSDQYVRLQLTGSGGSITVGAIGLGTDSPHKPENLLNDLNNTYLSQRVALVA